MVEFKGLIRCLSCEDREQRWEAYEEEMLAVLERGLLMLGHCLLKRTIESWGRMRAWEKRGLQDVMAMRRVDGFEEAVVVARG